MNQLIIRNLIYNNNSIRFKPGINIVVGPNGSGKTTLFSLLQFVLGIKNEFEYPLLQSSFSEFLLEVTIGREDYRFRRLLGSESIEIHSSHGSIDRFLPESEEFYDFLIEKFEPKLEYHYDKKSIIYILGRSFSTEFLNHGIPSKRRRDIYSLILGVNTSIVNDVRRSIKGVESEVRSKEASLHDIKSYIDDLIYEFTKEGLDTNNENFRHILFSTYEKYLLRVSEYKDLLNKSEKILNNIKIESEFLLEQKIGLIKDRFLNLLEDLSVNYNSSILDIIENRSVGFSMGEKRLNSLVFDLTLQASAEITNSIGLLVTDLIYTDLDSYVAQKFGKLVRKVTKETPLQYIEFAVSTGFLHEEMNLIDFTRGGRYA